MFKFDKAMVALAVPEDAEDGPAGDERVTLMGDEGCVDDLKKDIIEI